MGGSVLTEEPPTCWYVSSSWGVHDQRWVKALQDQGFRVLIRNTNDDATGPATARQDIEASPPNWPVVAGPLETVTKTLLGIPNRLIGLSWGFDLLAHKSSDVDHSWLAKLDHLIVDSVQTERIAQEAGLAEQTISVIPWGVDLEAFTTDGTDAPSPIVLSLRAHEPLYRVDDLFEAWPNVLDRRPDAMLLIGNSGSLTEKFEETVKRRGLQPSVRFLGRIPESDLPALLRSAKTYVSTSPIDGTSVTMLQAMACGVPVVVTDTENNRSWITHRESGYLFEPGDSNNLAEQLHQSLAAELQDHRNMANTARSTVVERADWTANTKRLRDIVAGG